MAQRTQSQLVWRRRMDAVIGVAAPFLDALLLVGDRVSRVAGRNDIDPEPPRRLGESDLQTRIDRAARSSMR